VIKNGRKKWLANPPSRLASLIEEKRFIVNEVKDKLESLFAQKSTQEFEVFQGEHQFVTHEFQMIEDSKDNDSIFVLGGKGDRFSEMLGDRRREYNAKALEKKISVRYIGTEDQRGYLTKVKNSRDLFDFRILPNLHAGSVSTSIHKDAVLFQVYGDPLIVFKIKSREISDNYATFFEALWNLC
jgi:hypothetical protein